MHSSVTYTHTHTLSLSLSFSLFFFNIPLTLTYLGIGHLNRHKHDTFHIDTLTVLQCSHLMCHLRRNRSFSDRYEQSYFYFDHLYRTIVHDFFQLPNVTSALNNITMLMKGNIVSEVSQGKESFLKIQKDIQHAVNQTIPVVSASIRRVSVHMDALAKNMTVLLDRIGVEISDDMKAVDHTWKHVDQYIPYRWETMINILFVLYISSESFLPSSNICIFLFYSVRVFEHFYYILSQYVNISLWKILKYSVWIIYLALPLSLSLSFSLTCVFFPDTILALEYQEFY